MSGHSVTKICEHCGKPYTIKASHADGSHYCSKACYDAAQFKGVEKVCTYCGKPIKVSRCNLREHNFCSTECRCKWLSEDYTANTLNVAGHSAGHKAPHLSAYNRFRNPLEAPEPDPALRGNYNFDEQRKVAELLLGHPIPRGYDVHHKNGHHDDNSPENIEVIEHKAHLKLHRQIAKEAMHYDNRKSAG